jgi:hypothetical protein
MEDTLTMAPCPVCQHVGQHCAAAPQGWEERAAYFGLDLVLGVELEGLGPDGAANVVDQDVDAAKAGSGRHP